MGRPGLANACGLTCYHTQEPYDSMRNAQHLFFFHTAFRHTNRTHLLHTTGTTPALQLLPYCYPPHTTHPACLHTAYHLLVACHMDASSWFTVSYFHTIALDWVCLCILPSSHSMPASLVYFNLCLQRYRIRRGPTPAKQRTVCFRALPPVPRTLPPPPRSLPPACRSTRDAGSPASTPPILVAHIRLAFTAACMPLALNAAAA